MAKQKTSLTGVLDLLEKHYGEQEAVGPSDPYEMILFVNCGYPATDASCAKGYDALKREVGIKPSEILAASKTKFAKLMRLGGIVPELRPAFEGNREAGERGIWRRFEVVLGEIAAG